MLESLARHHSDNYDLMFRTTLDPAIPLGENRVRDSNVEFRRLADLHVAGVLDDLNVQYERLAVDGHDVALGLATRLVNDRLSGGSAAF